MDNYIFKKDSNGQRPKNTTKVSFDAASYGDTFAYSPNDVPLRRYTFSGSYSNDNYKKIKALKNTINYYFGTDQDYAFGNISNKPISVIALSSYHLASGIQRGSVSLTVHDSALRLLDSATDSKQNGILYNSQSSQVGFVLYKEGFILLTGTGSITSSQNTIGLTPANTKSSNYCWHHYGASSSLGLDCQTQYLVVTDISTNLTMVYAEKGELNHSNNPTYLQSGSYSAISSSTHFVENNTSLDKQHNLNIKNTISSPFAGANAPFEKQTFISKIGIYDIDKKLIAIASLATPIKKTENREFLFKIKLDI